MNKLDYCWRLVILFVPFYTNNVNVFIPLSETRENRRDILTLLKRSIVIVCPALQPAKKQYVPLDENYFQLQSDEIN